MSIWGQEARFFTSGSGKAYAISSDGDSQMANFLVVYGTSDGHTAKIARSIGDTLRTLGEEVDIVEARTTSAHPGEYSAVIVAASVHAGGYQRSVRSWVRAHAKALGERPTAFVSVCLGVLQKDAGVQREVAAIIDRFVKDTGWTPTTTKTVAGALLYTRYNWIKRFVMKRIVQKAGGDTDTSRDYEYTDWNDLRTFAEWFGRLVSGDRTSRASNVESLRLARVS
jgi:menaquinone-dependent protoporphyrinogen oxidase